MAVLMITWACGAFNRSLCFCKAAAKKNGDGNAAWEKMLRPESLDCGNGVENDSGAACVLDAAACRKAEECSISSGMFSVFTGRMSSSE